MAPELRQNVIFFLSAVICTLIRLSDGACKVPNHFIGSYFSIEGGISQDVTIEVETLNLENENSAFYGTCSSVRIVNGTTDATGRYDAVILFEGVTNQCFTCFKMYSRTPNVVQYRVSSCVTIQRGFTPEEFACDNISPNQALNTMFRRNLETVNCKNTFEGVYHFKYEVDFGGGSRCDSDRNTIVACQEPGSVYVDNQVLTMNFGECPGVATSYNKRVRFQCMGHWWDDRGYLWAVMADTGEDEERQRFKCFLTRQDQQQGDNRQWWTMSRFSDCSTLNSEYDGDIRLEVTPVVYGNQLVEPQCNLPRNFSGTWFTTGEFDSEVFINATHVYLKTKLDQYTYRETYFTCQQSIDTRYLMTTVTVGKCEVDYICFDFMPRHHNIIRWRMGKPYRMMAQEMNQPGFMEKKFRQACSWTSFTIDRTKTDWTYNIFILDPPSPVDCPIAGRYSFTQKGIPSENYFTRVEGITVRPRHQIDCREYTSEMKSCNENTKKMYVDVEYCSTVDHTGRPIGEYDIADNELTCVGFWMEDQRSYMVTYDEMDAISNFRCWVYERLDWRKVVMSRSTRATCGPTQTPYSFTPKEGASLAMTLQESERIYDDCPSRYNSGRDPYRAEMQIYVFGSAPAMSTCLALLVTNLIIICMMLH